MTQEVPTSELERLRRVGPRRCAWLGSEDHYVYLSTTSDITSVMLGHAQTRQTRRLLASKTKIENFFQDGQDLRFSIGGDSFVLNQNGDIFLIDRDDSEPRLLRGPQWVGHSPLFEVFSPTKI